VTSLPRLEAACAADKQLVESATPRTPTGTADNYLVAQATQQMLLEQIKTLNAIKETYSSVPIADMLTEV